MANVRYRHEKMEQNNWTTIGIMSGTSLDGVDLCLCDFSKQDEQWRFKILHSHTYPYPKELEDKLTFNENLSATELINLDHELGLYFGGLVLKFLKDFKFAKQDVDLISSHGHTLYHRPNEGITLQIGNGPEIFATTGIPVVCDFRKQDVALGGQGAPLVPVGDKFLFGEYDACMNLGGFANISFEKNGKQLAFDIAPVNFVMNRLAQKLGSPYDESGAFARKGSVNTDLLNDLNNIEYYKQPIPKSLGAEWVWEVFNPLLWQYLEEPKNLLRTIVEHISTQIANTLNSQNLKQCLITGGGAYNHFLIEQVEAKTQCNMLLPKKEIIENKEALIFAFMGLLRTRGENNVLQSVTGASTDHSSGIVYGL